MPSIFEIFKSKPATLMVHIFDFSDTKIVLSDCLKHSYINFFIRRYMYSLEVKYAPSPRSERIGINFTKQNDRSIFLYFLSNFCYLSKFPVSLNKQKFKFNFTPPYNFRFFVGTYLYIDTYLLT